MIIIFDYGGVLTTGHIHHLYERLAQKLQIHPQVMFEAKNRFIDDALIGKITTDELIAGVAKNIGVAPDVLFQAWRESYSEVIKTNPDVIEIVKRLKGEYVLALLTNTTEIDAQVNRERGDYDLFDHVFTSYGCTACKPGLEIYMHVVRQLACEPRDCVFIDDCEENLTPAAAIGMQVIHYRDPQQLKSDLRRVGAL